MPDPQALARHLILVLFSAGLVLPSDLTAQRSARTTPRPGEARENARRATPTPHPRQAARDLHKAKPKYDVSYIRISSFGSTPTAWKPTPDPYPVPGGINCDYVYRGGSSQWVSATIWNDGGPAPGMIHVAPLLVRTDVAGDPPSLAAVPVEVAPPPPGGHGEVKLYYRVPHQVGKYQMRIFVAESQNHEGFDDFPFRGEWARSNYCFPRFHVVLPKSPVLGIAGASVDRSPFAVIARIRLENRGDGQSEPVTVKISRSNTAPGVYGWDKCESEMLVKAPAVMPGKEYEVKGTFPICDVPDSFGFQVVGYPDLHAGAK